MAADRKVYCLLLGAVAATVAAVVGTLLLSVVYYDVYATLQDDIRAFLVLSSPDAQAYPAWVDSSNPDAGVVYSTYWVYNVTNPAGILAGEKPALVEVGPLVYVYNNMKYNVSWDADDYGDVVSFKQYQYYTPADAATEALGAAPIVSLNVPLLSVLSNPTAAALIAFASDPALLAYASPEALFVTRSAAEVVWGWAADPFLVTFNNATDNLIGLPEDYVGIQNNDSSLAFALATHSPSRMHTGVQNLDAIMQMVSWDGYDVMMCCAYGPCGDANSGAGVQPPISPWASDDANGIAGSEGSQFAPGLTTSDVLTVETYDFGIYRHWDLASAGGDEDGEYEVEDISLLRFALTPLTFANVTMNPEEGAEYNSYGPSGLLNQSNCDSGAPIFLSKPRFLDADPALPAALANFSAPVPDLHDTWLGVEPTTGSTLDFHWRVAVNLRVAPLTATGIFGAQYTFFAGLTPVFFPVLWGSQDSTVSSSQATEFISAVYTPLRILEALRWGGGAIAILGAVIAVVLVAIACCIRRRKALQEAAAASASGDEGDDVTTVADMDREASGDAAAALSPGAPVNAGDLAYPLLAPTPARSLQVRSP